MSYAHCWRFALQMRRFGRLGVRAGGPFREGSQRLMFVRDRKVRCRFWRDDQKQTSGCSQSAAHGSDGDGARLVARLARIGIEGRERQAVRLLVMHRDEDLTRLHGGGDERGGRDGRAARTHGNHLAGANAEALRVGGVDLDVDVLGIQLAQDGALAGAGLRVPLRGGAASGEQEQGILGVGDFRRFARRLEEKFRPAVGVVIASVGEEATFCLELRVSSFEFRVD